MERVGETVGSIVWEGCVALMAHILRCDRPIDQDGTGVASSPSPSRISLRGQRVIELGAGIGILGCLAAKLGANVTITDREEILHVIRHNIDVNQLHDKAKVRARKQPPMRW
jgi:ribosomal protein L11 methylase PrmA